MTQIAERSFSIADLEFFANESGDRNPIHVDALQARRLLGGALVTHGILALLWALDRFCTNGIGIPQRIEATFHRPILVGHSVKLFQEIDSLDSNCVRLSIRGAEEMTTIIVTTGGKLISKIPLLGSITERFPKDLTFAQLKGMSGTFPVICNETMLTKGFPALIGALGAMPVGALMGLSRLVGMDCPGRHSLFSGLDVEFSDSATESNASWRVVRHTISQAPVRIAVSGGGLVGCVDAFVRPSPVQQPSMDEIMPTVSNVAYKGQVALIVGGSRGLGELTAKIIAAGGGEVIITYMHGKEDAMRVASEIRAHGGLCRVIQMDVMQPDAALDGMIDETASLVTHCYYFASPKISQQRKTVFDPLLYESFCQVYVQAFGNLVNALSKRLPKGLCVFYPSTIFIEEGLREFGEYIIAKTAGEALCQHFNRHSKKKFILVHRLPRLPTDQTAGLIRRDMANSLAELTQAVTELHCYFDTKEN